MYTVHWLAIDAVQPAIPQNPTASEIEQIKIDRDLTRKASTTSNDIASAKNTSNAAPVLVKQVLSRELTIYFGIYLHCLDSSILQKRSQRRSSRIARNSIILPRQ